MNGRKINWSPNELAWIKKNRQRPRRAAHKLFCEKFLRTDIKLTAYTSLCKRKCWLTGRTGRYFKGGVPSNKGKKMPFNANSARTQFKKGNHPTNYKPIGTELLNGDGYVYRKINNDLPVQGRWRGVHLIQWEEVNGRVPDGHCLKSLDGDKTNTDPDNWTCISRGLLPRLAGRWAVPYDGAAAELKPIILTVAKLHHTNREVTTTKNQ